uniref:ATPase inhibitor, mitochondrial n=2 Tax=Steinernema glaseri TaxID=37863 RepID=A0A1I7YME0_9BILA
MALRLVPRLGSINGVVVRGMCSPGSLGDLGAGSGKGGGGGGSIRDAGGAFGKLEAAREDEYFHKLQRTQLKAMKEQLAREIEHHEQQAGHHQDVIARHQKRIEELEKEAKKIVKE